MKAKSIKPNQSLNILPLLVFFLFLSKTILAQEIFHNEEVYITSGNNLYLSGRLVGGIGARTTSGALDWNHVSNVTSGSAYTLLLGSATNGPSNYGNYYHPFNFEYSTKNGTGNITQFAIPYGNDMAITQGIYFRGRYSGSWTNWRKIVSQDYYGNAGIEGNATIDGNTDIGGYYYNMPAESKLRVYDSDFPSIVVQQAYNVSGDISIASGNGFYSNIALEKDFIVRASSGNLILASRTNVSNGDIIFTTSPVNSMSDSEKMRITDEGNVGIGTNDTQGYKLAVAGNIIAEEVVVKLQSNWPDYTFDKDYKLNSLEEVEAHINEEGHLSEIPSAEEIEEKGYQIYNQTGSTLNSKTIVDAYPNVFDWIKLFDNNITILIHYR